MVLLLRLGILIAVAATVSESPAQSRPAADPAPAQGVAPPGEPREYWLRVTGDRVHLRSRGDRNSVAVARVDRDTVLRAVTSEYGWHRVLPPKGVFSYVSAKYIDQLGHDRGVVSVRSGNLRVRVGSLLMDRDPLRSEVQTLLPRGTEVRIVGRQDGWFKIAAPQGVFLHVSDAYVERISAEVAERLRSKTPAQRSRPDAGGDAAAAATQPTVSPDLSGPWGQRLLLVETAIEAQARRPVPERSWTALLARLRPIAEQREEPAVARLAQEWINQLKERMADEEALRAARSIARREDRAQERYQREMEELRQARSRPATRPVFAARGQLRKSYALPGGRAGPRYKLQDPLTRQVVAYVEFDPQANIKVADYVDLYVGVVGERALDKTLGADVIRVRRIEIATWKRPASRPARQKP